MSKLGDKLESFIGEGGIDLRPLIQMMNINFSNLSLDDVRFMESELSDLRRRFADAEKVDCFKTYQLFQCGFFDTAYFSIDEIDLVKKLANERIEKGWFDFKIEKVRLSKDVLAGHIKDRKEWERP